jgi:putative protein kinase ArgK-like GTPase of G3E family
MSTGQDFAEKIFTGDTRSVARAITKVENGTDDAAELMKAFFRDGERFDYRHNRFARCGKIFAG